MKNLLIALPLFTLVSFGTSARADQRRFAFSYGTNTAPQGTWEVEEQFRWKHGSGGNSFSFKQELEFGVTDRLQLGLYLGNFEHVREDGGRASAWTGSGLEAIYQMTNASKDWLGSALYGEALLSDTEFELEGKLLLQKNFGPWSFVWNGILEAKWEDGYAETEGVLEQTLGICYEVSPALSLGLEAKHEVAFNHWKDAGDHIVSVGPNLSFRTGDFFAVVTCLFQVTDRSDEPRSELGIVLGWHF